MWKCPGPLRSSTDSNFALFIEILQKIFYGANTDSNFALSIEGFKKTFTKANTDSTDRIARGHKNLLKIKLY